MPLYTNIAGRSGPGPLEADPTSAGEGMAASAANAFMQAPGITALEAGIGAISNGGPQLSHDDAVKALGQGYDGSSIPASGINAGALDMIRERQDALQANQSIAARSDMSTPERFISSLVGGLPDPVNLAATALAPEARGASLTARVLIGGVEGAGIMAAGVGVQQAVHGYVGDPDTRIGDAFRDIALGAVTGAAGHAIFGERPGAEGAIDRVLQEEGGKTNDTGGPTNFGISEKAHPGLDVNNLTQEDARGIYKREYWDKIGGDQLPANMQVTAMDAAVNQGVDKASMWLKEAGGDPEKFNALRRADYERLAAENPEKYGKYLNGWLARLNRAGQEELPTARLQPDELQTALVQSAHDSPVNVAPVADHTDLSAAVPKPNAAMDVPRDFVTEPLPSVTSTEELSQKGPLETAANEHLADAMSETKGLHESLEQEVAPEVADRDEEIKNTDEFTKAVQAAVQCGMRRGLD